MSTVLNQLNIQNAIAIYLVRAQAGNIAEARRRNIIADLEGITKKDGTVGNKTSKVQQLAHGEAAETTKTTEATGAVDAADATDATGKSSSKGKARATVIDDEIEADEGTEAGLEDPNQTREHRREQVVKEVSRTAVQTAKSGPRKSTAVMSLLQSMHSVAAMMRLVSIRVHFITSPFWKTTVLAQHFLGTHGGVSHCLSHIVSPVRLCCCMRSR